MRPIMSKEVRARLRYISIFTVQMIRESTKPVYGTRRQISPVPASEPSPHHSLFGEMRACMHWLDLLSDPPSEATACGRCADLGAGYLRESLIATVATEL